MRGRAAALPQGSISLIALRGRALRFWLTGAGVLSIAVLYVSPFALAFRVPRAAAAAPLPSLALAEVSFPRLVVPKATSLPAPPAPAAASAVVPTPAIAAPAAVPTSVSGSLARTADRPAPVQAP